MIRACIIRCTLVLPIGMRVFAGSVQACRRALGDRGPPSPSDEQVLHLKPYLGDDVLWTAPSETMHQEPTVLCLWAEARVVAVVVGRTEAHRLLAVETTYLQLVQHILEIC